jgi:hypothetical protein
LTPLEALEATERLAALREAASHTQAAVAAATDGEPEQSHIPAAQEAQAVAAQAEEMA